PENVAAPPASRVVFTSADGRTLSSDDLRGVEGTVRYEIIGAERVSDEAKLLHDEARIAGRAGELDKALALLERAADNARSWPYPVYDMAFTYLLKGDTEKARKYYRKTIELAPRGFFTALTALDALDREARGDLPSGTYLTYLSLEWTKDEKEQAAIVGRLLESSPGFAPAWKSAAVQTDDVAEKLAAIERGLAANPDGETQGILLLNKALVLDRTGDHEGAVRLLGELALDPASTLSTEQLAKAMLDRLIKE
ncbi:MAG TPA: tetratricopeptide repeat protein, partial [Pirellulales bacterium]